MSALASNSAETWVRLWETLTYQLSPGSRVPLVLRGTTMLGMACGVVGAFLLLRKRSLVADALSHAALPGVCVGFLAALWLGTAARWGIEPRSLAVLMPAAAVFGMIGVACVHWLARTPRVKEDAAIGVVLSVFFAIGIVLLSVIQRLPIGNAAGLNQFIFGQAATMSALDANIIAITALVVMALAMIAFKELKLLCFDQSFGRSLGWSMLGLDGLLLAMVTALTVIGLGAVGAILMVALLIIPPAAARYWSDRLGVMIGLSAVMGAAACHIGTACSAAIDRLPTGPAIVVACGALFVISMLAAPRRGLAWSVAQRMALNRSVARQHLLRAMYEQVEISGAQGSRIVTIDQLQGRRAWTPRILRRSIRRGTRRGEVTRVNGGYALTDRGSEAAATIVRTHRLWEHFLTAQADIAPSHVDRAADDIEHVLSDELIRDLEDELRASGALAEGGYVPRSAHQLAVKGTGAA